MAIFGLQAETRFNRLVLGGWWLAVSVLGVLRLMHGDRLEAIVLLISAALTALLGVALSIDRSSRWRGFGDERRAHPASEGDGVVRRRLDRHGDRLRRPQWLDLVCGLGVRRARLDRAGRDPAAGAGPYDQAGRYAPGLTVRARSPIPKAGIKSRGSEAWKLVDGFILHDLQEAVLARVGQSSARETVLHNRISERLRRVGARPADHLE